MLLRFQGCLQGLCRGTKERSSWLGGELPRCLVVSESTVRTLIRTPLYKNVMYLRYRRYPRNAQDAQDARGTITRRVPTILNSSLLLPSFPLPFPSLTRPPTSQTNARGLLSLHENWVCILLSPFSITFISIPLPGLFVDKHLLYDTKTRLDALAGRLENRFTFTGKQSAPTLSFRHHRRYRVAYYLPTTPMRALRSFTIRNQNYYTRAAAT